MRSLKTLNPLIFNIKSNSTQGWQNPAWVLRRVMANNKKETATMNVYNCYYQGVTGYGCRSHGGCWMFVPELGQPDNRIYKNIALDELKFRNLFEKQYEIELERQLNSHRLLKILMSLVFPVYSSQTVGGLLFRRF